ncbi:unnamed protein product [Arabidopsis arenosa]|uniref:Uncharacterized protein n=1 Tax=Arabidopsis arenosa TaxID=38785 RepID=A0A8S2B5P0_ARAAE|nr:unnamed protein product [Arabidopsis arenosa]
MATLAASSCLLSCLLVLFLSSVSAVTDDDKQVYIVYMGSLSSRADYTPTSDHMSILQEATGESSIEGRLVRSYKRSFNGFAARLSESEREKVAKMVGVVSVFPNKKLQLQTTTSWDFMGLKEGKRTKRNPTVESDTIIGVIDSGITPESQSFADKGFGPPPKKWKGVCSGGENFTCNNKLIGARDYTSEGSRDTEGHASTTNRGFVTKVVLGNGKTLVGKSVNAYDMKGKEYPLVYGKSAASSACDPESAGLCELSCLDESRVKGKILVCGGPGGLKIFESVGAIGLIYQTPKPDVAFIHPLPAAGLLTEDFESLLSYLESADSPHATVLKTEAIFNRTSPVIASFSSRGPNTIAVDILKPDITAPGVEILAAYSPDGVAAYVKTFYPKWSPSMIQSAIMTTAWPVNATGTGIASTEFAYGAGHVDPIAASNPGLVYELDKADHIAFLCGMNYTSHVLKVISGETVTCSEEKEILPRNLNYPSMSAKLSGSGTSFTVTFNRTLTNVGTPNSAYTSKVVAGHGSKLDVKIMPSVLSFKAVNEKQSFMVTVTGSNLDPEVPSSANLIWSDGVTNDPQDQQVYVVYMGSLPSSEDYTPMSVHMNILQETFNPKWSPSMIHSAIMTTAWPMNATGTDFASTEFAYGAGHVDPIAATNPGLVYEMDKADHIAFLCGLNYTADTLKLISGETITCTKENKILPRNLNYPSMSAQLPRSKSSVTVSFNRTVTNVGTPNSTYKSKVVLNHGSKLSVKVTPSVLSFKTVSEKKSFTVTVTGSDSFPKLPSSASLIWSDGTHNVRSPIVVYTDDAY